MSPLRALAVLTVLTVGGLPAWGQSCQSRQVYTAPVYHEPYNGAREGYRYDQQAHEYVKIFVAQPILVPVPVPASAFINLTAPASPPVATVSASYVVEKERLASAGLAEVLKRLDRMEQQQRAAASKPKAEDDDDLPPSAGDDVAAPGLRKHPASRPREFGGSNLNLAAIGVLTNRCAMCHTGSKARGDVQIFNDDGTFDLVGATKDDLWKAISKDKMPKGPVKCPEAEKALVHAWSEQD